MACLKLDSSVCTGTCINIYVTHCLLNKRRFHTPNVDCNLQLGNLTYTSKKSYTQSVTLKTTIFQCPCSFKKINS